MGALISIREEGFHWNMTRQRYRNLAQGKDIRDGYLEGHVFNFCWI